MLCPELVFSINPKRCGRFRTGDTAGPVLEEKAFHHRAINISLYFVSLQLRPKVRTRGWEGQGISATPLP